VKEMENPYQQERVEKIMGEKESEEFHVHNQSQLLRRKKKEKKKKKKMMMMMTMKPIKLLV
jgi:hypothetical protein